MTVINEVLGTPLIVEQQAFDIPEIGSAAGALAVKAELFGTPANCLVVDMAQRSSRRARRDPRRPTIIVDRQTANAQRDGRPLQSDGGTPPGGNHNGGYGGGNYNDDGSGDEEYPSVPFHRRRPTDRVERPGESFYRDEIDRNYLWAEVDFSGLGNDPNKPEEARPHYELTPLNTVAEILGTNGRASIADIGCGTGRMLYMLGRTAAQRAGRSTRRVSMTGFSRYDYSKESQYSSVIQAMQGRDPLINYVVGDAAQTLRGVSDASQDVTLAYNLLIHLTDPTNILEQMLRITRRTLFFTCDFFQAADDLPIGKFVNNLRGDGYPVLDATLITKMPEAEPQPRIALPTRLGVRRPSITVFRVDIPQ